MPPWQTTAAWATGLMLLATCGSAVARQVASQSPVQSHFARTPPEHTGSITLGTLSVKTLGVDRPWDPHVCIGCGRNNSSSLDQRHRH
ncbi:hypothetical protein FOHLNKBM_6253 [Methylobacterium longum]|nr:hypothetical protein FOHLNKBM_6253 [Methylobacterium longum]